MIVNSEEYAQVLKRKIETLISSDTDVLLIGGASDWPEYRERVGAIRRANEILAVMKDMGRKGGEA